MIYHRLGWTKTYLTKAGLIRSVERGVYQITPQGENILSSHIHVDDDYLMQYDEVRQFMNRHNEQPEYQSKPKESTPLENIDQSIKMISSRVSDELLDMIISKDPAFFEKLVLDLLDKMGYAYDKESIISTDYSGDEGIDGIINEDQFGFNSIYIQAKKWNPSNLVSSPEIDKFRGAMDKFRADYGIFITTSSFTREAKKASRTGTSVITLIDSDHLIDLIAKYKLFVEPVTVYQLSDFFNEKD